MNFLRNAWYCAGWAADLGAEPITRTYLNEPVLLYRLRDGRAVAIGERCPHRFAPLHKGKLRDDCIECPYHGLRFDASGACVHNPHGDGAIPKAARVKAYPLVEQYGALWIWMGDPSLAGESTLIDAHEIEKREGWDVVRGQLNVQGNYELLADNLLDLSHVPFLHPFLSFDGPPPPGFSFHSELKQDGNTVYAINLLTNTPVSPLYKLLWDNPPEVGEMRAHMRWDAPCTLMLDTGMNTVGGSREDGPSLPTAHFLTPETETSTHYFWAQARDRKVGDEAMSALLAKGVNDAFQNEDEPMIEDCQRLMGTPDLMSLKPVLLQTDAPAIRARRVLASLREREQKPAVRAEVSA